MSLIYQNPLWPGYLADPFVLKSGAMYYAYGTGSSSGGKLIDDGRMFPVLQSPDLVNWRHLGGALELEPLTSRGARNYWVPEVAEKDGRFYLYYSADGIEGRNHQLRVALSDDPAGPFRDSGRVLFPDEEFSIDAHPFCDPKDGRWYLFFSKNFHDGRIGTGTAVVPLEDDLMTPIGTPQVVLRAAADWHISGLGPSDGEADRGPWHTVEGAFVVERDGLYYCFYSGGAWTTANYGVGYGVADNVMGPYVDDWNIHGPAVLRGVPGQVLGPGHNSIVMGPDNRTQFVVYHAWDVAQTGRRICIDPLIWTPDGPRCNGPSWTPQTIEI